MRGAVPLAALVALALPGPALAHARLLSTSPGYRERLEAAPTRVVLRFDQSVHAAADSIDVRSAAGRQAAGRTRVSDRGRVFSAPLGRLGRGAYTVRWRAFSSDGHVTSGVFTFGVGVPAPPPTEAYGAGGPTRVEHGVRWAYFLALALLVGGLGFRLLVLPRKIPAAAERRFFLLSGLGAVAALEVGVVAFLLRSEDALQLPLDRLLYADLAPIATGTRFGTAFIAMTLGYAFVAALLFLGWLTDRPEPLWAAFAVGLGFISGLSLSGHSAAEPNSSWLSALADWVHLSAATLWLGGLVLLVAVVWPAAPALRREAFIRFSRLATVLIALIVGAGVYLSVLRLPEVADLWTTSYGHVLLVKLGLVSLALLWGAVHHFVARPALDGPGRDGMLARLPRSLRSEVAVGMAVLLAAAVLVDSSPPPPEPAPAPVQAANVPR